MDYKLKGIDGSQQIPQDSPLKIEAFLEEFPVRDLLPWRLDGAPHIKTVHVSRLTDDIIRKEILCEYHSEHIMLLDKNFKIVRQTSEKTVALRLFILFGPIIWTWKRKVTFYAQTPSLATIMDMIEELGDVADQVAYALSYHEWTQALIMYKRCKNMSLVGYKAAKHATYQEEVGRLRTALRTELAELD